MSLRTVSLRLGYSLLAASLVLGGPTLMNAAESYVSPAEARLRADVSFLADDLREGRGAGTKGLDAAAEYIATIFREAGLKPAPGADGYFQPFELRGEPKVQGEPKLVLSGPNGTTLGGRMGADFAPLAAGGPAALEGVPILFAGYGITAKDEQLKLDYDDYQGIDAKDKAVLVIRREPQQDNADSPFGGKETTSYATFRHKVRNAADHGAKAVLLVNDKAGLKDQKDELLDFMAAGGDGTGIPLIMVSREFAQKLLDAAKAPSLSDLEDQIDAELTPRSRELEGFTLTAEIAIEKQPIPVKNVVGVLEGAGPLADETIVVGAHYDHLGFGGSGSLAFGSRSIHNGADDNASGTATVMELARRLARRADHLPRRIVFMAFSGEERGLLGSKHYVEHPLYPLENTVAMINFDMVGRLNGDSELTIFGAGTIAGLDGLVNALAASQGIKPRIIEGTQMEFNASDHASFYYKNIPVLFAFTGTHPDYHRPSDDTERINFEGMARIANLGELVLLDLARRPKRPEFVKLPSRPMGALASRGGRNSGVYLGTRPAYGEEGNEGVKLDGVSEGSPAEKAGLRGGDIIVKFDGKTVANLEDYMEHLGRHKPGDTVEVVIRRDGQETTLKVTLGTRPSAN
jgi:hypothetical protein